MFQQSDNGRVRVCKIYKQISELLGAIPRALCKSFLTISPEGQATLAVASPSLSGHVMHQSGRHHMALTCTNCLTTTVTFKAVKTQIANV